MKKVNVDQLNGYLPYLNAERGLPRSYKSCSWDEDDRQFVKWVKVALIITVTCLIYIIEYIV